MSVIDQIDNSPLFQMLTKIVLDGPAALIRGAGSLLGSLTAGGDEGRSGGSGGGFSLGSIFGGGSDAATASVSQQPSMAIQTPTQSVDRFTVSMDELGTFSPPSVGSAARSNDMGMTA